PFELWQQAGWSQVAQWIAEDIQQGKALSDTPLPDWVQSGPVQQAGGVQTAHGSWNPSTHKFEPRSTLPVYSRQINGPRQIAEPATLAQKVVFEDEAVRCWTLPAPHPTDVLIVSFKTKMHTLTPQVMEGVFKAVDLAEREYLALVIAQDGDPFSAGADLKSMLPLFAQGGSAAVEPVERQMQDMVMRLRYAQVPVVAAMAG